MDDTLLMPDKTIHPDTVRDIDLASKNGLQAVYCTGRAVPELRPYTVSSDGSTYLWLNRTGAGRVGEQVPGVCQRCQSHLSVRPAEFDRQQFPAMMRYQSFQHS